MTDTKSLATGGLIGLAAALPLIAVIEWGNVAGVIWAVVLVGCLVKLAARGIRRRNSSGGRWRS